MKTGHQRRLGYPALILIIKSSDAFNLFLAFRTDVLVQHYPLAIPILYGVGMHPEIKGVIDLMGKSITIVGAGL